MAWEFKTDTPIHLQIVDFVTKDIAGGVLKYGSLLPPAKRFAKNVNVTPTTAERAYSVLLQREIITKNADGSFTVTDNLDAALESEKNNTEKLISDMCEELFSLGYSGKEIVTMTYEYVMRSIQEKSVEQTAADND